LLLQKTLKEFWVWFFIIIQFSRFKLSRLKPSKEY
jgi:hypothetical protein